MSQVLCEALEITYRFLCRDCSPEEARIIRAEIEGVAGELPPVGPGEGEPLSYEQVQDALGHLNERGEGRRARGAYYTPGDVVRFILTGCARLACGALCPACLDESAPVLPDASAYPEFCFQKTVYDPTCGAGEFLLAALELKLNLLRAYEPRAGGERARQVLATIGGNDRDGDSVRLTKLRLLLCLFHRFGIGGVKGLAEVMAGRFSCRDYVAAPPERGKAYDIIIGNPPYVEDAKSGLTPPTRYGNIYGNVLEHASRQLAPGGVLGFVIPLSYVATPRMGRLREVLAASVPEQVILSYSDRPDCLFSGVHQKLCVLLGRAGRERRAYTAHYRYWYREERCGLFAAPGLVENRFLTERYIPKLGTVLDVSVYQKLMDNPIPLEELLSGGDAPVYLNMRAAFWIKAFLREHTGSEYRAFGCATPGLAGYAMCLLNSSLFWWYWICVSDCWHITRKELLGFRVPLPGPEELAGLCRLGEALEKRLEETKRYVGTRQTEYEYKHRDCVPEIRQVDEAVNRLFGLTEEESRYIQNFAFRYRISGGAGYGKS